jgi:DNA recombination protein Rad52
MGFSDKQVHALRRRLNGAHVRTREAHGRELSYIEGWHAIAEANRIFGHDGWDRETTESRCVVSREVRGTFHAVYIAKVRIIVRAGDKLITREGHGTGEGRSSSAGEAHEMGLKIAETDGTKRALATFGNPFGLSLYLRKRTANEKVIDTMQPQPCHLDASTGRERSDPPVPRRSVSEAPSGTDAHEAPLVPRPDLAHRTDQPNEPSISPPTPTSAAAIKATQALDRPSGIDKSVLTIGYPRRYRDKHHLAYVASQPCLLCGRRPSDAHHLRFTQSRAMGLKVSDEYTVPLCRTHHRQLHQSGNETEWWNTVEPDVDPLEIAKGLWEETRQRSQSRPVLSAPDDPHPK